jgi:predicted protein tyrosine phosphatase
MEREDIAERLKILCICQRGNSRSVALAYIFKDMLDQDAIAIGIEAASNDTKEMLFEWADSIIVVDETLADGIPNTYWSKLNVWDVGPDRYFLGFHPELLEQFAKYINENGHRQST